MKEIGIEDTFFGEDLLMHFKNKERVDLFRKIYTKTRKKHPAPQDMGDLLGKTRYRLRDDNKADVKSNRHYWYKHNQVCIISIHDCMQGYLLDLYEHVIVKSRQIDSSNWWYHDIEEEC